jgi:hypothetical protein
MEQDLDIIECKQCGKVFSPTYKQLWKLKNNKVKYIFCSRSCGNAWQNKKICLPCGQCGKPVYKQWHELKRSKSGNVFCNLSCANTWSNFTSKKKDSKSILEDYMQKQLKIDFPYLVILYNQNEVISSELDIYIPQLNAAIEINGPLHYTPALGKYRFDTIKANDVKKTQQCLDKGIQLYIMDASKFKYLSKSSKERYYPQIKNLIEKLVEEDNLKEDGDD